MRYRPGWSFRRRQALRLALWKDQRGFCGICHQPMGLAESTLDHILPRAKGGTDDRWNLQLAHERCNMRKADTYHRSAS